jgi:hypothetical protein
MGCPFEEIRDDVHRRHHPRVIFDEVMECRCSLKCVSPLLAQSGHANRAHECPLLGYKQIWRGFACRLSRRSNHLIISSSTQCPESRDSLMCNCTSKFAASRRPGMTAKFTPPTVSQAPTSISSWYVRECRGRNSDKRSSETACRLIPWPHFALRFLLSYPLIARLQTAGESGIGWLAGFRDLR